MKIRNRVFMTQGLFLKDSRNCVLDVTYFFLKDIENKILKITTADEHKYLFITVPKSSPGSAPNVLLVGERKGFPSYIPENLKYPKFPDPHTYVRTLVCFLYKWIWDFLNILGIEFSLDRSRDGKQLQYTTGKCLCAEVGCRKGSNTIHS